MKFFILVFLITASMLSAHPIVENLNTSYYSHLQGIAADETGVYWTFTDVLVKTDYKCNVLKEVKLSPHMGDICMVDGDIFVATDFRKPEDIAANNNKKSAVLQFSKDLVLKKKHTLDIAYGIDGITFCNGKFYIAPGLGKTPKKETMIMVFDRDFKLLKEVRFKTGASMKYGAQNLTAINGFILASYYDDGKCSFILDPETFKIAATTELRPSTGFTSVPEKISGNKNTFLIGRLRGKRGDWKCSFRSLKLTPNWNFINTELDKKQ